MEDGMEEWIKGFRYAIECATNHSWVGMQFARIAELPRMKLVRLCCVLTVHNEVGWVKKNDILWRMEIWRAPLGAYKDEEKS